MVRSLSGGLGVLVVTGAVLYYTGAGKWLEQRTQSLGADCFSVLTKVGGNSVAQPVCSGVSYVISFGEQVGEYAEKAFRSIHAIIDGSDNAVDKTVSEISDRMKGLSSSAAELQRMISQGPQGTMGAAPDQFRFAIDSYAIANTYLQTRTSSEYALPWLEQGAAAQNGFGLMSQLQLARLYDSGQYGVPANPQQAQLNYQLASQSLFQLTHSSDPRARQLLQSLPITPTALQDQISNAMRELKLRPN